MPKSSKSGDDLPTAFVKARVDRIRGGGLGGVQASTIGLVLAGCIGVGVLLGQWLDNRFGTSYWTPILFLVGVAAGFREMLRTIRLVDAHAKQQRAEKEAEAKSLASHVSVYAVQREAHETTEPDEAEESHPRPRIFSVPAPPQASFDSVSPDGIGLNKSVENADDQTKHQTLTERLMNDESNDDGSSSP